MKQAKEIGSYLKVEPRMPRWVYQRPNESEEDARTRIARSTCEEMMEGIKRHVDDVGYMSIVAETTPVCSYCGRDWTEESDTYNRGCCDEDEAHNPEAVAETEASHVD